MEIYYSFDMDDAVKYGFEEAIFIRNFPFIEKLPNIESNYEQEKTWFKLSKSELLKALPFWTENQIKRIINNLKEQKVLTIRKFNDFPYDQNDQTLWYSINI